jgi:hypothetical protein
MARFAGVTELTGGAVGTLNTRRWRRLIGNASKKISSMFEFR